MFPACINLLVSASADDAFPWKVGLKADIEPFCQTLLMLVTGP